MPNIPSAKPVASTGGLRLIAQLMQLVLGVALSAALIAGASALLLASKALADTSPTPTVSVICEVSGGAANTVQVLYATPVRYVHVFQPLGGGNPVVFQAPATATQIYKLAVPAGSFHMSYGTGFSPQLKPWPPVIAIKPFKVVGRLCERPKAVGPAQS